MTVCPIDGKKIGFMGGWNLKDSEICNKCGKKVGLAYGISNAELTAYQYTLAEITQLIDHQEKVTIVDPKEVATAGRISTNVKPKLDMNGEFITEIFVPEHVFIKIDRRSVTITRKGIRSFANRGLNGDQVIPYSSIIGVNFKPAAITVGQINFVTAAGNQKTGGLGYLQGNSAYTNANTVVFGWGSNTEIEFIKDYVEKHMGQSVTSSNGIISAADEISKFKKLADAGIITQAEFAAKKKQLLGL